MKPFVLLLCLTASIGLRAAEDTLRDYTERVREATALEIGLGISWWKLGSALILAEKDPGQKPDRDELIQAVIDYITDGRHSRISENRDWITVVRALISARAVSRPLAETLLQSVEAHYAGRPNAYVLYWEAAFDALSLSGPLDESLIDRTLAILTPQFLQKGRLEVLSRILKRFEGADELEKRIWATAPRIDYLEKFGESALVNPYQARKWIEERTAKYVANQVKKYLAPLRRFQRAQKSDVVLPTPDRTELMREAKTTLQRIPTEHLEQCLRELEAIARRPVDPNAERTP